MGNISAPPRNQLIVGDGPISGAALGVGDSIIVTKAADTARNTTAAPVDDPHLQITNLPPGTYRHQTWLLFTQGAGGSRTLIVVSSATNVNTDGTRQCPTGGSTAVAQDESFALVCAGVGGSHRNLVGTTEPNSSGTLSVQWAQNVSDAADTTLLQQSWMEVTRIK